MNPFTRFFIDFWRKITVQPDDDADTVSFKRASYLVLVMVVVCLTAALSFFFLFLEGEEDVFVPDLIGLELGQALRALNEKNLYPVYREDLGRQDRESWGKVVHQDPAGGMIVKAGRRVVLTVGKPPITDRMPELKGLSLERAKQLLAELNGRYHQAGTGLSLNLIEPVTYLRNDAPRSTVLQQSPAPGADLFGPTEVVLVVSDGMGPRNVAVPNLVGLPFQQAMARLEDLGIAYTIQVRETRPGEAQGVVVQQSPAPDTQVDEQNLVEVWMTRPTRTPNLLFGLVETSLRAEPIPIRLTLQAKLPNGEVKTLARMNHPGGPVSLPYLTPRGTELSLRRYSDVIWSKTVISE